MKTPGDSAPQVDYISSANDLKVGEVALPPHLAMARTSISNDYQTPPTAGGMHTAALGGHSSAFPFPACKLVSSTSVLVQRLTVIACLQFSQTSVRHGHSGYTSILKFGAEFESHVSSSFQRFRHQTLAVRLRASSASSRGGQQPQSCSFFIRIACATGTRPRAQTEKHVFRRQLVSSGSCTSASACKLVQADYAGSHRREEVSVPSNATWQRRQEERSR
jgi:hypothetical protein